MKNIIPLFAFAVTAVLLALPDRAGAQSQNARPEYSKPAPKKVQRRGNRQYVDTSCHTYGGYGWGPYFGPCPFRGEVYATGPGAPVFGPFLPFGPFW